MQKNSESIVFIWIDVTSYNVRIDEDLYEEYLYKNGFEFKIIDNIDPYGDTILEKNDIVLLISDCDIIINLENNVFKDFVKDMKDLKQLCQQALSDNKNIICIGD